jgi:phosphoketolase
MRAVAQWLAAQARPGDVVITGIPNLDEYDPHIDYFFLDEKDSRYESYVCPDGVTERWTNHPVLYTLNALNPIVAGKHRVFAILYRVDEERVQRHAAAAGWSVTNSWTGSYAKSDVLLIAPSPVGAGGQ